MELTAINQLWVADITYIRLETEFVYLAVVLDAFSRRVVGWALGQTLEAELVMTALRRALSERQPAPGLVHHSDRGVQYACGDYIDLLKHHQITISMSRKGNPYDNAACESFMKTLKYEEVYRQEYRNKAEARPRSNSSSIRSTTSNGCTLLWAIARQQSSNGTHVKERRWLKKRAPSMRFMRHEESINPMWSKTWWGHRLPDPKATADSDPSAARTTTRRPLQGVGPDQAIRTCQEAHALPIVWMSSGRLFLDRVARQCWAYRDRAKQGRNPVRQCCTRMRGK
jgi:Integrase core domain